MKKENDLGKDKISSLVLKIAIPSMLAQFVNVLYSIVDRMFVGNIESNGDLALAGVGICGPIVTMITAFAFLVGIGGAPLMGIAMGEGKEEKARRVLANSFVLLCVISVIVTIAMLLLRRPMLMLFGASDITYPFAEAYFTIYVLGTIFALLSLGLYQFVVAQGYAKIGMFSVILGATMNILLDPVFIFGLHMGVRGAAVATVLSQIASCSFVIYFLLRKAEITITFTGYNTRIMKTIMKIGMTPFVIIAMDNIMIIAMNALLQKYGHGQGDVLITINTIVQSFLLVMTMPLGGISGGTQCILAFNYGACNAERVIKAEKYIIGLCVGYTTLLFILARTVGTTFVSMFTDDPLLVRQSCEAIRICTVAAIPLGVQYAIVDGFTGMGLVNFSLPLSFARKGMYFLAIFLIPLFFEASAIFWAQPISDVFSVTVSIPVFLCMIPKLLKKRAETVAREKELGE